MFFPSEQRGSSCKPQTEVCPSWLAQRTLARLVVKNVINKLGNRLDWNYNYFIYVPGTRYPNSDHKRTRPPSTLRPPEHPQEQRKPVRSLPLGLPFLRTSFSNRHSTPPDSLWKSPQPQRHSVFFRNSSPSRRFGQTKFGCHNLPHLHDFALHKVCDDARYEFNDFGVSKSTECSACPA